MNEITSYPQYCYACSFAFVSSLRHSLCPRCNSDITINCFGETYSPEKEHENGQSNSNSEPDYSDS